MVKKRKKCEVKYFKIIPQCAMKSKLPDYHEIRQTRSEGERLFASLQ